MKGKKLLEIQTGLKQNWRQFALLVLINAFVGGMVGMERNLLPQIAESEYQLEAKSAILTFIVIFGITKALTNYYTGKLANTYGRKKLLVFGWIVALPIPFLLMYGPSWEWILFANLLLGVNQGLCWSSTVVMKIDLVGHKDRGLAMGLNESAGYLAVGAIALLTSYIAAEFSLRPYPFMIGILLSSLGLILSGLFVKDTTHFVHQETVTSTVKKLKPVFAESSWKDKNIGTISISGIINNLNDGMIWGLLPILLFDAGTTLTNIGLIVAIYPAVWGFGQAFTGKLADLVSKKKLLFWGMLVQGISIFLYVIAESNFEFILAGVLIGMGTAVVYPTFLAALADYSHPEQRAEVIGIYRLWRDLGYAIGAISSGIIADLFGIKYAIIFIGLITIFSAFIIQVRMTK